MRATTLGDTSYVPGKGLKALYILGYSVHKQSIEKGIIISIPNLYMREL